MSSKKFIVALVAVVGIILGVLGSVPVSAKGVSLNKDEVTLRVKEKTALKLTGAISSKVQWKSSDRKIAKVTTKGVVKGVKAGTAVVYAYYCGNEYECTVTVEPKEKRAESVTNYADVTFGGDWAVLSTACGNYSSYSASREVGSRTYSVGMECIFLTEDIAETQALYEASTAETYIKTLANSFEGAEYVYVAAAINSSADFALYKCTVRTFDGEYLVYYTTMVGNIQINATLTADDGSKPSEDVEASVEEIIKSAYPCAKSWATLDTID